MRTALEDALPDSGGLPCPPRDPRLSGTRNLIVRNAVKNDMPEIAQIYANQVLNGLASFEEVPPSVCELLARRQAILDIGLPYLAADLNGRVVGYCYASAFRPRPAYRGTIENSVYVAEGLRGRGIGRKLLTALISRCEDGPWTQMIAVIGDSANRGSIALHQQLGFRRVGTLLAVGYKLGRSVDTVLMQRALEGSSSPTHNNEDGAGSGT